MPFPGRVSFRGRLAARQLGLFLCLCASGALAAPHVGAEAPAVPSATVFPAGVVAPEGVFLVDADADAAIEARWAAQPSSVSGSTPEFLHASVGGAALFRARSEILGPFTCTWRTDGTVAGTQPLPGCPVFPTSRVEAVLGDRIFFPAARSTYAERDLWVSDGTVAGTRRLTDLSPGGVVAIWPVAISSELELIAFLADDGSHGLEPWISDGTEAGTRRLLDFTPGAEGTVVGGLWFLGDRLYLFVFAAEVYELWSLDLGDSTADLVATLPAGQVLFDTPAGVAHGMVFSTREQQDCDTHLWVSDGTAAGTRALAEFSGECGPLRLRRALGGGVDEVFFRAEDPVHGREVWSTDGAVVRRITGFDRDDPFDPNDAFSPSVLGGDLFVSADGGPGVGREVFRAATPATTAPLADICPGDCSSVRKDLFPTFAAGSMFFAADDGVHGVEPWVSDGTAAGTRMRADVCPGPCAGSGNWQGSALSDRGFLLHYLSDEVHDEELWRSDPVSGEMHRLTDLAPERPFHLFQFRDAAHGIVFAADDGVHGVELWRTDGTAAGTRLLANLVADPEPPSEPPAQPHGLTVEAYGSPGVVDLSWQPGSGGGPVEEWVVEARTPHSDWSELSRASGSPVASLSVELDLPHTFRVVALNAAGASAPSDTVSVTPLGSYGEDPCADPDALCLRGGRFLVEVDWRNQHAGAGDPASGVGRPLAGTDRSGYFWFFREDNVELVVKVLDGSAVNGYYWTFYGGLSDVEYWVTVTDLHELRRRTYYNPPGRVCGEGDTASIAGPAAAASPSVADVALGGVAALPMRVTDASHPVETCVAGGPYLCLLDGRFRLHVEWTDQHNGGSGDGTALPYSDRTGFFTFFNPTNVELVVKMLDGTGINGKVWLFYGALSDVGYTLTVEDLVDGHSGLSYVNQPGEICGKADTAAF